MTIQSNPKATSAVKGKKGFQKGMSGNPGGRAKIPPDVIEAARAHSLPAITHLAYLMTNATDEKVQVSAAESLLNRAWGKPTESMQLTGSDDEPLRVSITSGIDFAVIAKKAKKK